MEDSFCTTIIASPGQQILRKQVPGLPGQTPNGRKRKVGLNFWYAEDFISNRKYQEVRKINKDRPEKNNEGAPVGGL